MKVFVPIALFLLLLFLVALGVSVQQNPPSYFERGATAPSSKPPDADMSPMAEVEKYALNPCADAVGFTLKQRLAWKRDPDIRSAQRDLARGARLHSDDLEQRKDYYTAWVVKFCKR